MVNGEQRMPQGDEYQRRNWKGIRGSGHGLLQGTVPKFAWRGHVMNFNSTTLWYCVQFGGDVPTF